MTRFLLAVIAIQAFLLWQTAAQRNTLSRDLYFAQTASQVVCAPEPAIEQLNEAAPQPAQPTEVSH